MTTTTATLEMAARLHGKDSRSQGLISGRCALRDRAIALLLAFRFAALIPEFDGKLLLSDLQL